MTDLTVPLPPARTAPPRSLVVDGRYRFGTYDAAVANVNPLDASRPGPLARRVRNLRLKEWEAFQLGDDEWFALGAVYNTKTVGLLQLLAVHKESATITRWETKLPAARLHVARGLSGTRSHGRSRSISIGITNEMDAGRITVDVDAPGSERRPELALHGVGRCSPEDAGHLVICHPFSDDRALYSHKAMMPFSGTLAIGDTSHALDVDRSFMILDDHHGDYPSPMRYDWLTGVRRAADGRLEGFNLTRNQIRDPDVYNENALWLGNQVHRLPPITIERPNGPWEQWRARDASGAVDVTFTPTVRSAMHVGPRRSLAEYYAPYGWFEGRIETGEASLDVDGFFGVGEQKLIRV